MDITWQESAPPIEQFWRLFETTGWNREYQATPQEMALAMANSQYVVAAYANARLVGFGRVVTDGVIHAMIYDLIVAPEHQNHGLGTRILERLVIKCLAANIRDIQLFCAKGKSEFYEQRGFVARPANAPGMQYKRLPAREP